MQHWYITEITESDNVAHGMLYLYIVSLTKMYIMSCLLSINRIYAKLLTFTVI